MWMPCMLLHFNRFVSVWCTTTGAPDETEGHGLPMLGLMWHTLLHSHIPRYAHTTSTLTPHPSLMAHP